MTEILAPVGGHQQLIAAINSGADAVYLGTKNFNARRNASNFDSNELKDVVSYCHSKNVKVYVTMNTLINDSEINDAINNIYDIANSGADAIIVQDLAVAYLVKKICPEMKLHASTQMTVTNIEGVKLLQNIGFSRVVLARELSFNEIKDIVRQAKIETEVFVHGALCMSVSGNCYLSSAIGERSGNRGLCAQPCRLNFKCKGKSFALSLKDMSYIKYIPKLEEIGVSSLKIEGRMKRPEYVAIAVDSCKKALCRQYYNCNLLKDVFSRGGFTDGYFTDNRNHKMFGIRSKQDVDASNNAIKQVESTYCYNPEKVNLFGTFTAKENFPASLTITDGKNTVCVKGNVPEIAKSNSLEVSRVKNQLLKTGNTSFIFKNIDVVIDSNLFLPISEINNMRRKAIEQLSNSKNSLTCKKINQFNYQVTKHRSAPARIRLRFQTFEQSFDHSSAEYIILPIQEIIKHPECLSIYKEKLICELPSLCFQDNLGFLSSQIDKIWKIGVKNVLCNNICIIEMLKNFNFNLFGGYGLNIQNSIALDEYNKLGINDFTVSFELYYKKISNLGGNYKRGIIGYGHLPLMNFRCCPAEGQDCKNCNGRPIVTDRLGKNFQIVCAEHKYSSMLNCVPLYIGDKTINNIDFYTLFFTFENKVQSQNIVDMFISKRSINTEKTSGMYFRKLI